MSTEEIYIERDGYTYLRIEPTEVAREIGSLKLVIRLAEEKIAALDLASRVSQEGSEAIEDAVDEINDIEMAIDDLKVHLGRLSNIPRNPAPA
jgi:methyl-accepting chemotaxis protein